MKKTDELKALLDRLRGEVGPVPDRAPAAEAPPARPARRAGPEPAIPAHGFRRPGFGADTGRGRGTPPPRPVFPGPERLPSASAENIIWSENKEAMIFGVLASLVAILGGILASLDWLILIGAGAFALFSLTMFLALSGRCLNLRAKSPGVPELAERLDALSRQVDALVSGGVPARSSAVTAGVGSADLERKVEELRALVKSLAKAVGEGEGKGNQATRQLGD